MDEDFLAFLNAENSGYQLFADGVEKIHAEVDKLTSLDRSHSNNEESAKYLYNKGLALIGAKGDEQDENLGFDYISRAADKNLSEAQRCLGIMYGAGYCVEANPRRALIFLAKAASQGDTYAISKLGKMFTRGVGIEPSLLEALAVFEGSGLAVYFEEPEISAEETELRNIRKFEGYKKHAAEGVTYSIYLLGRAYELGLGVEKNECEALKYYHLAGAAGNHAAFNKIAKAYAEGRGVGKDEVISAQYNTLFLIGKKLSSDFEYLKSNYKVNIDLDTHNSLPLFYKKQQEPDTRPETPNVSRPIATNEMPEGDQPPPSLENKENIQQPFSAAADAKAIGLILTAAREEAGMTKAAVAAEMNTVPKSIIRLEKGEQSPTVQTLDRFAKALGYTVRIELTKNDAE